MRVISFIYSELGTTQVTSALLYSRVGIQFRHLMFPKISKHLHFTKNVVKMLPVLFIPGSSRDLILRKDFWRAFDLQIVNSIEGLE